ncbi:class A beta-lactamase-related serine hydrolase [Mycolicibacterium komossense]|uniref:class A beta-lactamase-related serine hydrolase n=1 Tax=Mycolicibacterium komossense TaxID=1779 RepID=UPI0021F328F6|nr:class A beta-lactamase-related serine hydrolase [Mycolicibacterium komossense]
MPLVIAEMRTEQDPSQVTDAMRAAITQSDNAAAEQIWRTLGDPTAAAAAVEQVLQEYRDPTTVQSEKVRPEFSAFGQSDWTLTDQSRFLAAAACDDRNAPVLALMGQIEDDQKWGLGVVSDAQFKGGWGPSQSGSYLVRQMGIIPTPNGLTVAAIAAEPTSGSFADGIQALTAIARLLDAHRSALPAAQCP